MESYQNHTSTSTKTNGFLPLNDTPVYEDIDLLSWRKPDDFQPRAQLRKLFNSKDISTKSKENIDEFCKQFAVDRRLVIEQLQHFEYLEYKKQKRSTKKQVEQAAKKLNTYDDIEWQKLYTERKLKTLSVNELDLFIEKHIKCGIDTNIKKNEKIHVIEAELAKQMAATFMQRKTKNKPSNIDESSDESSSSDDSETEILDLDDGNSTDESEDETNEESNQPTVSRYGRRQGNWRTRQFMDI